MTADGSAVALDSKTRRMLAEKIESMADLSLRCLAFATKRDLGELAEYDGDKHPAHKLLLDPVNYAQVETDLVWLGVAGLQDPPRPEVKAAIEDCRDAGIRVRFPPPPGGLVHLMRYLSCTDACDY